MDYLIVDDIIAPPGEKTFFVEQPIRMPGHMSVSRHPTRRRWVPFPFERNGLITFGCMNNPGKVNKYVIDWWAKILTAFPIRVC